jgi:hypothetical protein
MTRDEMLARFEDECTRLPRIWTIYDHPRDIPGAIVVRCWSGLVPHPDVFLTQSIESARARCLLAGASVRLERNADDDPVIVESWI